MVGKGAASQRSIDLCLEALLSMQERPVVTEHREKKHTGRTIISSLLIGLVVGLAIGSPLGWFVHQFYAQQRAAQVLLCRQRHYGQPEAELQRMCGSVF